MDGSGLHLVRSSRIEGLALHLLELLRHTTPDDPLQSQHVVVAHPALGRWLLQAAALHSEAHHPQAGIVAGLEFVLAGAWQQALLDHTLGPAPANAAAYARESLRWVLLELLDPERHPGLDAELAGFLGEGQGDAELRRFQLADHLAAVYTQYLVYRRQAMARTELAPAAHWQDRLWRRVVDRIGPGHRAERMDQWLRQRGLRFAPAPLILFGFNHLPPDLLRVLDRMAAQRPVWLYVLDPAPTVYWTDQARGRARAAQAPAHPLLAAWGGQPQQMLQQIQELTHQDQVLAEPDPEPAPTTRLQRLQEGLRLALPAWGQGEARAAADASLRIHVCPTPMRELEILRDALLELLVRHPHIHPRDIVVMAPDIQRYAPLVGAVFASASVAAEGPALPWQLADRTLQHLHPVLGLAAEWLDLPSGRVAHSAVADMLAQPMLQRGLGLSPEQATRLSEWLVQCRVAFGLDGAHKQALGAGAHPAHSFAHALDQIWLGLLSGGDETLAGFADMAPLPGVAVLDLPLAGALQTLLEALAQAQQRQSGAATVAAWSQWVAGWLGDLLVADPDRPEEQEALAALQRAVALPAVQAAAWMQSPVRWAVWRDAFRSGLLNVPERSPFTRGGITFCGMVPARVLPFEIVAVLGLDAGALPRTPAGGNLNLMRGAPQAGDRDPVAEDRALFLETLLSARTALHLSCCGLDPYGGEGTPPATPLAELIEHLELQEGARGVDGADWWVTHPVSPLDPRYFDPEGADPRRYSYARRFAVARPALPQPLPAFAAPDPGPASHPAAAAATRLPLASLVRYLRRPPEATLGELHRLDLHALVSDLGDDEDPLQARFAAADRIGERLLERCLQRGVRQLPEAPPAWLQASGLMPSGLPGELAWAQLHAQIQAALDWIDQQAPELYGHTQRQLAVGLTLADGVRLEGRVPLLHTPQGLVVWSARIGSPLRSGALLVALTHYAMVHLSAPALPLRVLALESSSQGPCWHSQAVRWQRLTPAALQERLHTMVRWRLQAETAAPPWRPVRTLDAALEHKLDQSEAGLFKVRECWTGNGRQDGERSYAPYAALQARGLPFLHPPSVASQVFRDRVAELRAVLEVADNTRSMEHTA